MRDDKKTYSLHDKVAYRIAMRKFGIDKYKPIRLLSKVVGYSLLGYGIVTCWFPSGSQLALLGGCALLGIPFGKVWGKVKLYGGKVWFALCVLTSKKRIVYECRRLCLW